MNHTFKATMQLRWYVFSLGTSENHPSAGLHAAKTNQFGQVLQQWWVDLDSGHGEWRDLPMAYDFDEKRN